MSRKKSLTVTGYIYRNDYADTFFSEGEACDDCGISFDIPHGLFPALLEKEEGRTRAEVTIKIKDAE